jgi:isoquinoline 1-oxidoreductase beta subunit
MHYGAPSSVRISRRSFLKAGTAASLIIGFHLPTRGRAATVSPAGAGLEPNAFVRIGSDDVVTVIAKHIEFGQGSYTGLATIVAEELDADWSKVRVESAPADATRYNNLAFGNAQGTGGSTAIANSWDQLRRAGATARTMLVQAAAQTWDVPASEITVTRGVVAHAGSQRQARFGELVATAAQLTPPTDVTLKTSDKYTLIGTHVPKVDTHAKSNGTALFTLDVYMPDMLTAVIARPPRFGAKVASFDANAAKAVPGVTDVVQVPAGIAVVARDFWAAKKGRDALQVQWDESAAEKRGSEELFTQFRTLVSQPGAPAKRVGDAAGALASAAKTLEAVYEFPYLAHAPMEPLDCVVKLSDGACELWMGSQIQTVDQAVAAQIAGLKPEQVKINTLFGGGSFGRRATPNADVAGEAVSIAKALNGRAPVKLVWTREDDIRGGRYRPLYVHRVRAGLDASGKLVAWEQRVAGQSILAGSPFADMIKDGVDPMSVEGSGEPYAVPNVALELHTVEVGVPVLWWRSVGHTHTAFATETFIDEAARAAGADAVAFRRAMLAEHPRHLAVLDLAAEKAGWGKPLTKERARGVAVHESFDTVVAEVAEISVTADGMPKVERVTCAVDCGIAVNPDIVRAQMESAIGYGLGAILYDEIVLEEGRVQQSNFDTYRPLRISEMPQIDVHIVSSTAAPTGAGAPGVPPNGPAVANAYFQLTGKRVRRLPFTRGIRA